MAEEDVMGNFQSMIANLVGPHFNQGSQPDSDVRTFTLGGGSGGPRIVGTRWTFSTGGPQRGYERQSPAGFPDLAK